MLSFPAGYPSGVPLTLSAEIEIDAPIDLGAPVIGLLSAQVDFNPVSVPEPRYPILSLLVVAISLAAWRKGRKRSSAS